MGTQEARDIGLWVYERLHYVIVFTVRTGADPTLVS